MHKAQVVKLDRGFPLVRCESGLLVRCEHATSLVKGEEVRAVIGDYVEVTVPEGHDKGIIETILPRSCEFVRKDPTERALPQVLAANFDLIFVVQPLVDLNMRRLERELVLAYETGAQVAIILTKADLADDETHIAALRSSAQELVGASVDVLVVSEADRASVEVVRSYIPAGVTAVLLGKSGVGKSSLVNRLVGSDVQETTPVRDDGKGRHTTVSRQMVQIPGGGYLVDMPGVRGLGLWDADSGIGAAFSDIEDLAEKCRFRDCQHLDEPGCAVVEGVVSGEISQQRYDSYQLLRRETSDLKERRKEASRMRGEKASDRPKQSGRKGGKSRPSKKR